jgi:DnaK suppressor protein
MTQEQRDHLEKRLLHERERALGALARFHDSNRNDAIGDGDLTTYPLHLADEGTDTMEQEKAFLLASKEGRLVYAIDDALRKLYREPERFGKCDRCGTEISDERLDLVPWARLCVDCKMTEEESIPAEEAAA